MKRKTVTGGGATPLRERYTDHGPGRAHARRLIAHAGNVTHNPESGGRVPPRATNA